MGTSSPYPGPTGRNPLLPPWPEEHIDDTEGEDPTLPLPPQAPEVPDLATLPPPAVTWDKPKAALTRWATGGGQASGFRRVAQAYVAAHGGSRRAAASARAGRASTARLASFLSSGLRVGFADAARGLGLHDTVGRDAQFVLTALVDRLSPAGALAEEAVAHTAMIDTLIDLFDQHDIEAGGIAVLDALDVAGVERIIVLYVVNYVNARFQHELVSRLETGRITERRANALMRQIKAFIASIARLDLQGVDVVGLNWTGTAGREVIVRLYEAAYMLLGRES